MKNGEGREAAAVLVPGVDEILKNSKRRLSYLKKSRRQDKLSPPTQFVCYFSARWPCRFSGTIFAEPGRKENDWQDF